jgi:hypothetical protein
LTFAVAAVVLTFAALAFVLFIRPSDIPEPEPENLTAHLEDRKKAIYENLRDLTFEYRLGKLSEPDYQKTKLGLQGELAGVLAEIDRMTKGAPAPAPPPAPKPDPLVCPHCSAKFDKPLKFCGECGKPMSREAQS